MHKYHFVRKIIYTTNAIESLNRVIRKTTKTRGSFPTDAAATKLIYRKRLVWLPCLRPQMSDSVHDR